MTPTKANVSAVLLAIAAVVAFSAPDVSASTVSSSDTVFGAYFVDWAHYRAAPYKHTAESVAPIISRVNIINYSFLYFCPPAGTSPMPYWAVAPYGSCTDETEYQLMMVDPADTGYISTMVGYKSKNPSLKVVPSVGGWNFPSSYFSKMVSTQENRAKWIASVQSFVSQHQMDGVNIDWEYPCSPSRMNPVKISCGTFRDVSDAGGSCPEDTNNFALLAKELREAAGDSFIITIASQAAQKNWESMGITQLAQYVDRFDVMTYDYSVSDIPTASMTAPNAPLFNPPPPSPQWSIDYTVQGYLKAGIPASKIAVGIALYGHTWYTPGVTNWKEFGVKATEQNACCGPFKTTYGAKYGKGCQLCGSMMYSEILAAGPTVFYDNTTQSAIGYMASAGKDGGYTEEGTWISYTDPTSIRAIASYALKNNLAGLFVYDTSMDTVSGDGSFTFQLMNLIADLLPGHGTAPSPAPSPPPSPPGSCSGKAAGMYCVNKHEFMFCPQGSQEPCPAGTCCQQSGASITCGYC